MCSGLNNKIARVSAPTCTAYNKLIELHQLFNEGRRADDNVCVHTPMADSSVWNAVIDFFSYIYIYIYVHAHRTPFCATGSNQSLLFLRKTQYVNASISPGQYGDWMF